MSRSVQIVSAPSILGLRPSGVEMLGESLLHAGLKESLTSTLPVIAVPHLNPKYNLKRDKETCCLNPDLIREFSESLMEEVTKVIASDRFPMVLGGDCSILIGIMACLRREGNYGLVFLDAHADFYEPEKSTTGEVADMDLAIVTGRGPDILTNIQNLRPYVQDQNVLHLGQRDLEETKKYGSRQIQDSGIKIVDLNYLRDNGVKSAMSEIHNFISKVDVEGFWIHFDCDVINDDENPAVDYRLPGGLSFHEAEQILCELLNTNKIIGISVTIFNPLLDSSGQIRKRIVSCLSSSVGRLASDFV
jgi:arginase